MSAEKSSALIVGVGAATGAAVCRELNADHKLAMVARSTTTIGPLEAELDDAKAYPCDVSDRDAWAKTMANVEQDMGVPDVVVFNTEGGGMGPYNALDLDAFNSSFSIVVTPLLAIAQTWFAKATTNKQSLKVIVTSSPIAFKVNSNFTGLGPARWGQRFLTEALRDSTEDSEIDLSILSIDGAIDEPKMRAFLPNQPDDAFIKPDAIAALARKMIETPKLDLSYEIHAKIYAGV